MRISPISIYDKMSYRGRFRQQKTLMQKAVPVTKAYTLKIAGKEYHGDTTFEIVNEYLKNEFARLIQKNVNYIEPGTKLQQDLGADSLDMAEIVSQLEYTTGYEFSEKEAEKFITVQDIVDFIDSHFDDFKTKK